VFKLRIARLYTFLVPIAFAGPGVSLDAVASARVSVLANWYLLQLRTNASSKGKGKFTL